MRPILACETCYTKFLDRLHLADQYQARCLLEVIYNEGPAKMDKLRTVARRGAPGLLEAVEIFLTVARDNYTTVSSTPIYKTRKRPFYTRARDEESEFQARLTQ